MNAFEFMTTLSFALALAAIVLGGEIVGELVKIQLPSKQKSWDYSCAMAIFAIILLWVGQILLPFLHRIL